MTAVFTPGYAPVEQFTSAPQGAWTDIYSLAATLYHAITGAPPPNAIDRLLDDALVPLADRQRAGFPRTLLAGIDAGLAVRAADRPQSVEAWRGMLAAAPAPAATVVMPAASRAPAMHTAAPASETGSRAGSRNSGMKIAAAAAVLLLVTAGGWFALNSGSPPSSASTPPPSSSSSSPAVAAAPTQQDRAQQELEQARREQRAAQEEAARLRADAEVRRKADDEAALRTRIEQEMRDKAAAEQAALRQVALRQAAEAAEEAKRQADSQAATAAEAAARTKADAEAAAKAREEGDRQNTQRGAEAAETALRLSQPDRQRVQIALTALGFATGGTDGVLGARSREMIAAWQKKAGRAATGYLTQDQQAALLREAAPALARHDEEQKKLALAPGPTPSPTTPGAPAAAPAPAAAGAGGQCDGTFRSQWCRAAYQGFPPSCWNANMTIRNGAVSDSWVSQADGALRNTVTGRVDAAGNVSLTLDGIGQQTHVNQRFTAQMSGRITNGLLTAVGRGGAAGREFTVNVRCR